MVGGTLGTAPACMGRNRVDGWKPLRSKVGLRTRAPEPVTVLMGVHLPVSETTKYCAICHVPERPSMVAWGPGVRVCMAAELTAPG